MLLQETELPQTATDEVEAIERYILTHRDLLRQVTSYPNRKLKQPDFLPYDPADVLTDPVAFLPPESYLPPSDTCRSERRLKPLQELCNSYFLTLVKEQLAHTERRLRGDRSVLHNAHVTRFLSKKLTLTNFLFELWKPEDGEEEEEERESAEAEAPPSKSSVKALNAKSPNPESFFSCVEELPIKLVAGETRAVTPDPNVSAEMTGSVSSNDSIEVLGTEKSYRTQHVDAVDSRGTNTEHKHSK